MGKLQGVRITAELSSLINKVLNLTQPKSSEKAIAPSSIQDSPANKPTSETTSTSPSASLARAREALCSVTSPPTSTIEACMSLEIACQYSKKESSGKSGKGSGNDSNGANDAFLPLFGVQEIKFLIENSSTEEDEKLKLIQELESALRKTTLSFKPKSLPAKKSDGSPTSDYADNPSFQKRMERLRLQDEERSYVRLTNNLKDARSLKDDNVTAKSMMYATSVGLNMIVAPLSFGVFMYFFAGQIFSRFFGGDEELEITRREGEVDIRRVIAGVVSGVFMLFVEMILFVIRSHELDASVRKKSKRKENRANPFGYTEKTAAKIYNRDD